VVGLHVVYHKIVQVSASKSVLQIFKKKVRNGLVGSVENNRLFVQQKVGVIRNSVGNSVDPFKESQSPVVGAYPSDHL